MSDELAIYTPTTDLSSWAADAHEIAKVAVNLAKTAFVPSSYNRDPAQITAAILTGIEVGLKPMAALRAIDIIQGTPALKAVAMRALAQSAGHEIWVEEATETRAIVCGRRKGSDHVERSVWTIDRATKLGLAGKDNWRKQPGAMLIARATSELVRLIAADVVLGVPYSSEELADDSTPMALEQPVKPARKTIKRAPLPATVDPPLDEPVTAEPVEATPESDAAYDWPPEEKP